MLFDGFHSRPGRPHRRSRRPQENPVATRPGVLSAPTGINHLRSQYAMPLFILMGAVALVLVAGVRQCLPACCCRGPPKGSARYPCAARSAPVSSRLLKAVSHRKCDPRTAGRKPRAYCWRSGLAARLVGMMANGGSADSLREAQRERSCVHHNRVACDLPAGRHAPGLYAARADVNSALKEVRVGAHSQLGQATRGRAARALDGAARGSQLVHHHRAEVVQLG